jgi:osmotically-inducible protein OsmY
MKSIKSAGRRNFLQRAGLIAFLPIAGVVALHAANKPVSDDFLVDTIRQKLAADAVVRGGAIEVIVKDGNVTLRGKVEEDKQKNRAEKIAKKVSGVKSVMNELQLSRP